MIKFSDFYDRFMEVVDPQERNYWTKIRVSKELPPHYPVGKNNKDFNARYIGNISWTKPDGKNRNPKLVLKNQLLIPVG
jgi:DNA modification methylase